VKLNDRDTEAVRAGLQVRLLRMQGKDVVEKCGRGGGGGFEHGSS